MTEMSRMPPVAVAGGGGPRHGAVTCCDFGYLRTRRLLNP